MFENLQTGLATAIRSISGKGRLTEANMREALDLVRQTLIEADVSFDVVKQFMEEVSAKATGEKVLKSMRPHEMVAHIVHQELIDLLGPVDHSLRLQGDTPVLMLCGLQGSGKTTTCGKLARRLQESGRKPLLVAADLQRPAAIDQLHVLGEQLGVPVYSEKGAQDPVKVCQAAVKEAKNGDADVVILDTAGRLHIDDELMQQLTRIDNRIQPQQVLFVVDGLMGQDAVTSAKAFNEALELDGVIMTKLDGDAKGGAALSVKGVTGVPIKYIGVGEHLDALEEFHPDRIAGRILGQGDLASLVELAGKKIDVEKQRQLEEDLQKGQFTLEHFRDQLRQIAQPGLMQKMLKMLPGGGELNEMLSGVDAEGDMRTLFGVIDSMTPQERRNPKVIDQSRRRRIAAGAGVEPKAVSDLLKQFDGMAKVMTQMAGKGMRERMRMAQDLQREAMTNPNGRLGVKKQSTGKRLSTSEKKKLKKEKEREMRRKKREKRANKR